VTETKTTDFTGQRATVMGLGLFGGGAAATRFLAERGAQVTVTDLRDETQLEPAVRDLEGLDLELILGQHRPRDFSTCDVLVVNPAVPPSNAQIVNAFRAGARITSEIGLFLDACPARVLAITGTQGKSSSTHYLAQLLEAAGVRTFLGGNIGRSLLSELSEIQSTDVCAVELSSYQLENLPEHTLRTREQSPIHAAGIVNIHADHLERHGTRDEYARAKLRLTECIPPGGTLIMPRETLPDDFEVPEDIQTLVPGGPELRIEDGHFRLNSQSLGPVSTSPLQAPFQLDNLLVALGLAALQGASPELLARAIPELKGLPHRLQLLGKLGDCPLWDNGVSTTPDSTISALETLPEGLTVLIGGKTKALDLGLLLSTLTRRKSKVVLFGSATETWPLIFSRAGIKASLTYGPEEALEVALEQESSGILFSPACSSFDAYPNFQARARAFQAHAWSLGLVSSEEEERSRNSDN
jgi:UDP-N-acetylmuramoylalanine--D-glutamate ligase